MKGLLLKDCYVAARSCRVHIGLIVLLTLLSLFVDAGLICLLYPIIFAGMIPTYILSVDEKSGWSGYAETLPYDRRDIVTGKYTVALISLCASALFMVIVWSVRVAVSGGSMTALLRTVAAVLSLGLLFPTATLPFMFRFGADKGRLAATGAAAILAVAAAFIAITADPDGAAMGISFARETDPTAYPSLILPAAIILFVLSWRLSIGLYKKREL